MCATVKAVKEERDIMRVCVWVREREKNKKKNAELMCAYIV